MEFAVVEQQLLVGNQAEQDWLRWYRQAEQLLGANLDGDGGYASKSPLGSKAMVMTFSPWLSIFAASSETRLISPIDGYLPNGANGFKGLCHIPGSVWTWYCGVNEMAMFFPWSDLY